MLKGVGAAEAGHVQEVAATLFSRYLFPFEVTSVLLLAAILGASVLIRKRTEHA
jgi:NADH-quinone oxidoreductase subunit J